jgi:hypothetical protein
MTTSFPEDKKDNRDVRGKKTANPGYQPGNHWVECQICACAVRSNDAKVRWDGAIVCPDDWEMRHPQDFVRGREDNIAAKGIVNPESPDTFTDTTRLPATSSIPVATFTPEL